MEGTVIVAPTYVQSLVGSLPSSWPVKVLTVHAGGYAVQKLVNRNGRTCGWFPVSGLILRDIYQDSVNASVFQNSENTSFLDGARFGKKGHIERRT
jgi:hypothetical protein